MCQMVIAIPGKAASSGDAQVTIGTSRKAEGVHNGQSQKKGSSSRDAQEEIHWPGVRRPELDPYLSDFWLLDPGDVISPLSFSFL